MTAHERIALIGLAALCLVVPLGVPGLFAQHSHPPQDAVLHDTFYSTWYRPDLPGASCCSNRDCAPAEARFTNGQWFARKVGRATWLAIPPEKVETRRDPPDGRSHLCSIGETVFCFIAGAGI